MGFLDTIGLVAHGVNSARDESERLRKMEQEQADTAWERASKFVDRNPEMAMRAFAPAAKLYGLSQPTIRGQMVDVPAPGLGGATTPAALSAQLPTIGGAPSRFGLNAGMGVGRAASLPTIQAPATVSIEDASRPDWKNPENVAAVRDYIGAPPDKLAERNPEHDIYNARTGAVVSKGTPAPYRMPYELAAELKRLGYTVQGEIAGKRITSAEKIAGGHDATSILNNTTTNATRVTTTGMNNTTSIANAATAAKAASDRAAAAAAAKAAAAEAKKNAAAAAAMAKKVQASGIIAEDMAKKFPWAGVQGVDPSTGDIIISAPVGALSPRNERLLMDYMPGTTVLGKGRVMVTGTPDLAHLRAKVKPPKAAPAPKPPKPFDADKARKNVMASMGLRPSQRIRPDQQARYDTLMQQERDAHNRASNGGKTALQMLLEMPD